VAETVDSLREGIQNGHWHDRLPGERELCESLQVSRRTLRSALAELGRDGWLEVEGRQGRRIKKHGSVTPNAESGRKTIAILTPGSFLSLPPRISFVMDTLRDKLTAAGCEVQFHINPACYTANPGRVLAKFVESHPATVWIILSAHEPLQRWFNRQKLACLILGSCAPGISLPSVDVDFHATGHHAGGLLWRKGHRRIALVLFKGIMHLMRRGRRVPADVAVISRDNDPILETSSPSITRYAVKPAQLAGRIAIAVRQLVETGTVSNKTIRLMPAFVPGESV
jgi:DNA-binding LacI/PurR family transcriptional regulator